MTSTQSATASCVPDSEQQLLGSLLISPSVTDTIVDLVAASDFSSKPHGRTFSLLLDMRAAGQPIGDVRVVRSRLADQGILQPLGGDGELGRIVESVSNAAHAEFHAKEIRRASHLRRLAKLGQDMADAVADPKADPVAIIRRVDAEASQLAHADGTRTVSIYEATKMALARLDAAASGRVGPSVPTGLYSVDQVIGGMYPGELIIDAARPSMGKSAFAANVATYNAQKGRPVLFVILEMTEEDIATRELAAELSTEVRLVRAGRVSPDQRAAATLYAESLRDQPLELYHGRTITVQKIRGLARLMAAQPAGLALIVVDYIGLVTASDRRKPRWEQVTEISGDLKTLAQELEVPVLACCQLGRDAEGKPPNLGQLRDSGAIEQDADVVMLLHRENRDSTTAELNIAKNRNGGTGMVPLRFDPATTTFSDLEGF